MKTFICLILTAIVILPCRRVMGVSDVIVKIIPDEKQTIRCVTIDSQTGDIAALKLTHDTPEVVIFSADGKLKNRFRPLSNPSQVAWLPGHWLLVTLLYPNRNKPPVIYSADGEKLGEFSDKSDTLQMFRADGAKWIGSDQTPGCILVLPDGTVLMSNTWADEDALEHEQIQAGPKRFDKNLGARVLVYSSDGKFQRSIGAGWGTSDGQMVQPRIMSLNADRTVLAVGNKNGIDLFDLASGKSTGRIKDCELVASARAAFLVVAKKAKNLSRIDFAGKEIAAYDTIQPPFIGSAVATDGSLFLPGGPGLTMFRHYTPDGKFFGAGGDSFELLTATPPAASPVVGASIDLDVSHVTAEEYYAGRQMVQPLAAFVSPVLGAPAWRSLPIRHTDGDHFTIDLPKDLSGPQVLRLAAEPSSTAELHIDFKLRIPGQGTGGATAFTSRNQRNFAIGQPVMFHIVCRSKEPIAGNAAVTIWDERANKAIVTAALPIDIRPDRPAVAHLVLSADDTKLLAPGNYSLIVSRDGLNSFPCRFTMVPLKLLGAMRLLVWDSNFGDEEWNYPISRGELAAWAGMNTVVRDMPPGNLATASIDSGDSDLLRDDPSLPAPEYVFQPNLWQDFMDRGIRNGVAIMPLVQTGWEGFSVRRDEAKLADDDHRIRVTAQSLSRFPNFRGFDFNGTNFFSGEWEKAYQNETGQAAPKSGTAPVTADWNWGITSAFRSFFDFSVGNFRNDYQSWSKSLRAITPAGQQMATITEADMGSWLPALAPFVDVLQSYKQSEQILPPYDIAVNGSWGTVPWLPHVSTFEGFNETGTGERLESEVAQAMLAGSYPGVVSPAIGGAVFADRSPNTKRGSPYVHREFFRRYELIGDLLTTSRATPQVGILISKNQAIAESRLGHPFRGDDTVWLRHYSALLLLQMAHRPARAVYSEHLDSDLNLAGLSAVLITGQTVPLDDNATGSLKAFIRKGGKVLIDADSTVDVPGAIKLTSSFFALQGFGFKGDHGVYQTDGTWEIIPAMLHDRLPQVTAELDRVLPAIYSADSPDLFMMPYNGGAIQYLALVNTQRPAIPDLQYAKMQARYATVLPTVCKVAIPQHVAAVYDVLSRTELPISGGSVTVDLRSYANTVLAMLPASGPKLAVTLANQHVSPGQTLDADIHVITVDDKPFAAAMPIMVELRANNGVVLASKITATDNAGTVRLSAPVPAGIESITANVLSVIGPAQATAIANVTGSAKPTLRSESQLASRLDAILPALRMAKTITFATPGDDQLIAKLGKTLSDTQYSFDQRPWKELKAESSATAHLPEVVIVTGGEARAALTGDPLGLLPWPISDHVPGPDHSAVAMIDAPLIPGQQMLIVLAEGDTGRAEAVNAIKAQLSKAMMPDHETALQNVPTPDSVNEVLSPVSTPVERFRNAIADPTIPSPALEAQLVDRAKSATARLDSLSLSADGKTLVVGAANWDTNLYAVDATKGNVKWTAHAGQNYVRQVWARPGGGAAAAILTTDDATHQLEMFSSGGAVERRFAAPGVVTMPDGHYHQFFKEPQGWSITPSPDGSVIVGAANLAIACWESSSGKLLWKKDLYQTIDQFTSQPSARLAVSPDGKCVALFYCEDGIFNKNRYATKLEICDLMTGRVLWTYDSPTFDHVMANAPVWSPDGKHVLIGHAVQAWEVSTTGANRTFREWPGSYRPGTSELFDGKKLLDAQSNVRWQLDLAGRPMSVVWSADGSRVAVSSDLGEVEMLDADGKELWRTSIAGAGALAMDSAGQLFVGDWSGMLYCFDMGGKPAWQTDLGAARVTATPLSADVYASPPGGTLVQYLPDVSPDPKPAGENVAAASAGGKIILCGKRGWGFTGKVAIDPSLLIDGKTDDLPRSWQQIDELWTSLIFETPPQAELQLAQRRLVTGIVVHESAKHPEAFPSIIFIDAKVDGQWQRAWQGYVKPAVEHAHTFKTPMNATAIRYVIAACPLNGVYTNEIEVMAK